MNQIPSWKKYFWWLFTAVKLRMGSFLTLGRIQDFMFMFAGGATVEGGACGQAVGEQLSCVQHSHTHS